MNRQRGRVRDGARGETVEPSPAYAGRAVSMIPIGSIEGFRIAHSTNRVAGTGCTVIIAPAGATGGVDVRGGAPASRETDLLRPENTVDAVHAVCLAGGSAFGLEAADGVARELEARGIGLSVGGARVPIVCASCLFDLAVGDASVRPGIEDGRAAVAAAFEKARDHRRPGGIEEGSVGAGTGATVGKLRGIDRAMKGGLGARALSAGAPLRTAAGAEAPCAAPLKVGAIAAVNACGNVIEPHTHRPIAGMRATAEGLEIDDLEEELLTAANGLVMPLDRTNTTISCIITNARLTKAQATKVAQMAADAYAHTIRPTHTSNDGDSVFVLASGALMPDAVPLDLIGLIATRALEQAICAGCEQAEGLFGIPGHRDLERDDSMLIE